MRQKREFRPVFGSIAAISLKLRAAHTTRAAPNNQEAINHPDDPTSLLISAAKKSRNYFTTNKPTKNMPLPIIDPITNITPSNNPSSAFITK